MTFSPLDTQKRLLHSSVAQFSPAASWLSGAAEIWQQTAVALLHTPYSSFCSCHGLHSHVLGSPEITSFLVTIF